MTYSKTSEHPPMHNKHHEMISLLPWLVNGTLNQEDAEEANRHLQECKECRQEIEEIKRLQYLQNQRAEPAPDTQSSLMLMRERINSESVMSPDQSASFVTPPLSLSRVITFIRKFVSLPAVPVLQVTAACMVAMIALLMIFRPDQTSDVSDEQFRVLSSGSVPSAGIDVYVLFDLSLTRREADLLLSDIAQSDKINFTWSRIGPGEYKISVTDHHSKKPASLAELSNWVEALRKRHEVLEVGLLP